MTEEYRECCYLADDLLEYIHQRAWETGNTRRAFWHCTGSEKEGVLNYNDIDLMSVEPDLLIFDSVEQIPDETFGHGILLMDTEDCEPGFTRLVVHTGTSAEVGDVYTEIGNKRYLNATKYMASFAEVSLSTKSFEKHGPALIIGGEKMDFVMCFKCLAWPKCANEFIGRPRFSSNPSVQVIDDMTSLGCHVVGISHPQSLNPDVEFRISFSFVEKHLIRKWSIKQLKCYFLLKELLNNYLGPSSDGSEKGLCSYFFKTLMFWAIEEYEGQFWDQNSTFHCVEKLLAKLKVFFVEEKCPNYFIADNRMVKNVIQMSKLRQ